jgi:hypothetical protein
MKAFGWQKLDQGLLLGKFDSPVKSKICNHKIFALKIDPYLYELRLLSATQWGRKPLSAKQWCNAHGLLAGTNAGMYQKSNPLRSTGYMRNHDHVNNSWFNPTYGAFFAFNPLDATMPPVQMIDSRRNDHWKEVIAKYDTVIQNYRMISGGEKVPWPEDGKIYGTACIGMDRNGQVLFILSRSPFSTHDFIDILLSLPLGIQDAMYTEGGSEATIYVKVHDTEVELIGTCDGELTGIEGKSMATKIPNLIGIFKPKNP